MINTNKYIKSRVLATKLVAMGISEAILDTYYIEKGF